MKLTKSAKANINYLAKVIDITNFLPHPNADRMKIAQVGGYKVCVGIDEPTGRYVYFPVNSEINPNLLSYCNLYRHSEKNANTEKAGFFNDNGRVTAIKLRGFPSEGFLLPYEQLENFIVDALNLKLSNVENNTDFDVAVEGNKELWICKKYIVIHYNPQEKSNSNKKQKKVARFNKVIDTQFHFHYDTVRIQNDKWAISPDDLISLSEKIHGCVDANTIINTNEGKKTIKEIVDNRLNVLIEAFDINTQQKVFVPIDNYYLKENDGDWYEIELENGQKIEITGNNPVWLPELHCYRRVDELIEGDILLFSDN